MGVAANTLLAAMQTLSQLKEEAMKPALAAIVILVIGVTVYAFATGKGAAPVAQNSGTGAMSDGMAGSGGMSGDKMSGDGMAGGTMSGNAMSDDKMSGGGMAPAAKGKTGTMEPAMKGAKGMKDMKGMKDEKMAGDEAMTPSMDDPEMKSDKMLPETDEKMMAEEPEMAPEK